MRNAAEIIIEQEIFHADNLEDAIKELDGNIRIIETEISGINGSIEVLEQRKVYYEIFKSIASGTAGTVTKPIQSTILLNRYEDAGDCLILKTDTNGRPIDEIARTTAGEVITSTFDINGNYSFSGEPSSFPVALVYQIEIPAKYSGNVSSASIVDIVNRLRLEESEYDNTSSNLSAINGQEAIDEIQTNNPGIEFDNTLNNPTHAEGRLFYDKTKHAMSYYNEKSDVTVNLGQEVLIRVKNMTGSTIPNGSIVYPTGFADGEVLVGLAIAHDKEKCRLIGVATHDIPNNETGYATKTGEVGSIDTSVFVSGDVVYLSTSVAGGITRTKPTGSNYITRIGTVKIKDATNGSIVVDIATSEQTVEITQDVGFSSTDTATLSFTDVDRTLTITPTGTEFCFYQYGDKYCKMTDSIVIPDEEGLFVIYYNMGTLAYLKNATVAQAEILIKNNPVVAYVYWNATNNKSEYVGYELHGIGMSSTTHAYLHFAFGARYLSGLAPNGIIPDASGNLATSAQFGIDSGAICDEDIYLAYAGIGSTVGLPIFYLSGTTTSPVMRSTTNAGYSILTTGTGRMAYNAVSGSNYVLSEVANGDYALCHVFMINENNVSKRLIAVVGQAQYTTLANAREGAKTEILQLKTTGIVPAEIKAIATFVFETNNTYTNAVKSRIRTISAGVNYVDWRTTYFNGSGSGSGGSGTSSTIFNDDLFQIIDNADETKVVKFEASAITTGNTRIITVPDANSTTITDVAQTFAGAKTFSTPITSTTANLTNATDKNLVTDAEKTSITHSNRTALDNVSGTNTGDQTSIAGITGTTAQFNTALTDGDFATLAGNETLTNKTLTSPIINTTATGTGVTTTGEASKLVKTDSLGDIYERGFRVAEDFKANEKVPSIYTTSTGYVSIPDNANINIGTNTFGFITEQFFSSGSTTRVKVYKYSENVGVQVNHSTANKIAIVIGDGTNILSITSTNAVTDGNLHKIGFIFGIDSASCKLVIDGIEDKTAVKTGNYPTGSKTNTAPLMLLGNSTSQHQNEGRNFRWFNYAPSVSEMQKFMYQDLTYDVIGASNNNVLLNGNFETGLNTDNLTVTGTITFNDTDMDRTGNYNCKIVTLETNLGGIYKSNLIAGKRYRMTFRAKALNGTPTINCNYSPANTTAQVVLDAIMKNYTVEFTAINAIASIILAGTTTNTVIVDDVIVQQIGCSAEYTEDTMASTNWYDKSGNNNHAILTNASLLNKKRYQQEIMGYPIDVRGANVASATTITPSGALFHVTGTTAIATINIPFVGFNGSITIIPDGIFTWTTAGNIALAGTAVVSKALIMNYDATTAKWYPSY